MNLLPLSSSIGVLEIIAITLVIIPTAILFFRNHSMSRCFMGATISVIVASIISPADLFSTVFLVVPLFAMFILGSKLKASETHAAS